MAKNEGGQAFPHIEFFDEKPIGIVRGMSLRDYFAAQVIAGLLTADYLLAAEMVTAKQAAKRAYAAADALIAERAK